MIDGDGRYERARHGEIASDSYPGRASNPLTRRESRKEARVRQENDRSKDN